MAFVWLRLASEVHDLIDVRLNHKAWQDHTIGI